jgi:hypothetical protein
MTTTFAKKLTESKALTFLISLVFALLPFQRRFHGWVDSWSRKLTLPDFPLPHFFSKKIHLFITDLLIVFLTLFFLIRYKIALRVFFWEGPSKYLTLLFFTAVASLYISITHHYVLQYFLLLEFSFIFLFFNAVCQARKKINFSQLVYVIAWTLVVVSCIQCSIGIYQYFTQHPLGLSYLGEIDVRHFPFQNPGKQRWLFDQIAGRELLLYRASGTFSHPNILGGFLFCSLFASFYLFMKAESQKILLSCFVFMQMFTLYISYSRSAIIAFLLVIFVWGFLQMRYSGFRSPAFLKFSILAASLLLSALLCIFLFYSQLTARGGILNYNAVVNYADSERVQYLKMAIDMIKDNPWLGIGFNNFQLYEDPIQPGYPGHYFFSKVHNIYLLVAAETGLIGGALFLLFIVAILKKAWRGLSQSAFLQEKIFLLSVFCGLLFIGACDFYLLQTPHGRILFFGFGALLYPTALQK